MIKLKDLLDVLDCNEVEIVNNSRVVVGFTNDRILGVSLKEPRYLNEEVMRVSRSEYTKGICIQINC